MPSGTSTAVLARRRESRRPPAQSGCVRGHSADAISMAASTELRTAPPASRPKRGVRQAPRFHSAAHHPPARLPGPTVSVLPAVPSSAPEHRTEMPSGTSTSVPAQRRESRRPSTPSGCECGRSADAISIAAATAREPVRDAVPGTPRAPAFPSATHRRRPVSRCWRAFIPPAPISPPRPPRRRGHRRGRRLAPCRVGRRRPARRWRQRHGAPGRRPRSGRRDRR